MGAEPSHYTRIPNLIEDDPRIDPFAMRVYLHYRRRAGECGAYEGGIRETARACGISHPIVIRSRAALIDAGYITVERRKRDDSRWVEAVMIADVWEENRARFQRPRSTTVPQAVNHATASGKPDLPEGDAVNVATASVQHDLPHEVAELTAAASDEGERSTTVPQAVNHATASGKRSGTLKKNPVKEDDHPLPLRKKGEAVLADETWLAEVREDFPTVNIQRQGRWWLDHLDELEARAKEDPKVRLPVNFKGSFRRWLNNSIRFGHEPGPEAVRSGTAPPPARQGALLSEENAGALAYRPRARAREQPA